jgi:WD40 repeat protein
VKQIAAALQYTHDMKLVHRDVKPENMLVGLQNKILLSDFGIAVVAKNARTQTTQDIIGTFEYTAPEQLRGKPIPASDQYSLACVIYEWLCGTTVFNGNAVELISQHLYDPPQPLRGRIATVSPPVENIILKALAKDPQQRFASVQDFASALEQACIPHTLQAMPIPPRPQPSPVATPAASPVSPRQIATPRVGTTHFTYKLQPSGPSTTMIPTPGPSPQPSGPSAMIRPAVAWKPDGQNIAIADQKGIHIWNANTKRDDTYDFSGVTDLTWSPDGVWIASSHNDGSVKVWDVTTGNIEFSYGGHFTQVNTVAWSSDSIHIASGDTSGKVHIWDVTTGYRVYDYHYAGGGVAGVAWLPDGRQIVSVAKKGRIYTCNLSSAILVYHYPEDKYGRIHPIQMNTVVWVSNGGGVACGGSLSGAGHVGIIDHSTKGQIFAYQGHSDMVTALACSPVSQRIASGSSDRTVQIWDTFTGKNVFTYRGHASEITSLAWSPDGKYIASADINEVQVWQAM